MSLADIVTSVILMAERHLLRVDAATAEHYVKTSTRQYHTILGLEPQVFIIICIILAIILTIIICIYVAYKRYRTRVEFNENPEKFANLP